MNLSNLLKLNTGVKIVLIYLVSGVTWILLSDTLLERWSLMSRDVQIWKGIGFVVATSIILYFLLKYYFNEINKKVHELEQKSRIEEELRQKLKLETKKISALINNTDDFIWSVDKDYNLIIANEAYFERAMENYGVEIKKNNPVFPPELDHSIIEKWKKYYDRGLAGETFKIEEEVYYPLPDMHEYIEVSVHPIHDIREEVVGVSCLGRNITSRKENELLIEQKNKKLMEIAWYQSHELRTPLSRIMGLIYLVEQEYQISLEHQEILDHIKSASVELDEIIRKVVKMTENLEDSTEFPGTSSMSQSG